ncbi:MAG: metallophosphoesterase [Solirubrobacteraceae bacterium]
MRTLVISDLHLGARPGTAVLERASVRATLVEALSGVDRLILLGDVLELRGGSLRRALDVAAPVLADLGAALGAETEVVVVPGNHDHRLLGPWRERRAVQSEAPMLELETEVDWRPDEPLAVLAESLAPARVRAVYPGLWLRDDIYAIHGHYLDRHITVPILERVGAGAMLRLTGPPRDRDGADAYEAILSPMYDWADAVAEVGSGAGLGLQGRVWNGLQGRRRRRSWRQRSAAVLIPVGVAALNRAGLGPLNSDISGPELRRAGLRAFDEVLSTLGISAPHVLFGHTHRAGPLPDDDPREWTSSAGAALHNTGSWIHTPEFLGPAPTRSPYRPGFVTLVGANGPPELVNLLDPSRSAG